MTSATGQYTMYVANGLIQLWLLIRQDVKCITVRLSTTIYHYTSACAQSAEKLTVNCLTEEMI